MIVPGITLRPLSPIKHTYTAADGRSESDTNAPERAVVGLRDVVVEVLPGVRADVAVVPPPCLADPPPPLESKPTSSSKINRQIVPTAMR